MALRARKVFGAFEKRPPDSIQHVSRLNLRSSFYRE